VLDGATPAASAPEAAAPAAGAPAVTFGSGHRPETATHVRFDKWEGPLGLLLSLIEARRLDILSVSLGGLAEAYLDALASLEDDRMGNISSFVAVASQLILIKSRAMLPRAVVAEAADMPDEGEDPERELRARLLLYRAYRDAGLAFQATAIERVGLFHREPRAAQAAGLAGARPSDGPPLDRERLVGALNGLARIIPEPERPPEIVARSITLTQRAALIREALLGAPSIVLQELLRGVRDRVVIAVTFLAMLELMKRREIVVEQAESFGPITARRTTREERAAAGIADDIEQAPLDESLESFA
jgi:segregation and condensation protein A